MTNKQYAKQLCNELTEAAEGPFDGPGIQRLQELAEKACTFMSCLVDIHDMSGEEQNCVPEED